MITLLEEGLLLCEKHKFPIEIQMKSGRSFGFQDESRAGFVSKACIKKTRIEHGEVSIEIKTTSNRELISQSHATVKICQIESFEYRISEEDFDSPKTEYDYFLRLVKRQYHEKQMKETQIDDLPQIEIDLQIGQVIIVFKSDFSFAGIRFIKA